MGYPHPRYLQPLITSSEFTEWLAYFQVEPHLPGYQLALNAFIGAGDRKNKFEEFFPGTLDKPNNEDGFTLLQEFYSAPKNDIQN